MNFEFASPTRILFGEKRLREVGELVASMGSRALVVQGSSDRAAPLVELLRARGIATTALRVSFLRPLRWNSSKSAADSTPMALTLV